MNSKRTLWLAATTGVAAFASSEAFAQSVPPPAGEAAPVRPSADFVDLTGSVGYTGNPFLNSDNSRGSAFGRLSARGVHAWSGERGSSSITGFVEGTSYLNHYGVRSIFSVNANTSQQVSERVRLFGAAGVTGDLSGQLSNRFLYVPPVPEVPDVTEPPPATVEDPDLFSFNGRQYRFYGQGGAAIQTSARGSVLISGGAQRVTYTNSLLNDYTTFFADGSYGYSLSERTTVGFSLGAHRTEYDNSSDHTTIINPALTVRTRLSEDWNASAAVGVSFAQVDRGPINDNSTNLSLRGSVCHDSETERLCGRVSRYAQTSATSSLVTTNSVGVDWYKKLDQAQTIQLSASFVRYSADEIVGNVVEDNVKTRHLRVAGSYARRINDRLSGGADVGVRSLHRELAPDPRTDFTGSVFLRYRLGDLG